MYETVIVWGRELISHRAATQAEAWEWASLYAGVQCTARIWFAGIPLTGGFQPRYR